MMTFQQKTFIDRFVVDVIDVSDVNMPYLYAKMTITQLIGAVRQGYGIKKTQKKKSEQRFDGWCHN